MVYMFLIAKKKAAEEGAPKCCFLSLAGDGGMSQTFPRPTPRFVGSDVNTVCSSAPIPGGAIWESGGGCLDPRKYQ